MNRFFIAIASLLGLPGIPASETETVAAKIISPSPFVRAILLILVGLASAISLAPFGLVVLWPKLPASIGYTCIYWLVSVGAMFAACFAKKVLYWAIWAALVALTVLNAIGTLRFLGWVGHAH